MDTRNRSEKFWDRAAKSFDRAEKKDEKISLKIIETTKNYLKPSDTILDFGCGTGLVSIAIAGKVKMVHAVDLSANMIEIAKSKAEGQKIQNIEFSHTRITDKKFEVNSFDVILAMYILHLMEDPEMTMKRIYELLKPGGLIISATPCLGEWSVLNRLFLLLSSLGIIPEIKSFKLTDLEKLMTNSGFEIVRRECIQEKTNQFFIVAKK